MIGPANAIVSAALGFWAAEALTLFGALFWWIRPANYRPAFCLVDGEQIDYEKAAQAAVSLETEEERERRHAAPATEAPPLAARLRLSAALGLGCGLLAGLVIGLVEALAIAQGGSGAEAQVLWYGPLAYAAVLGALGLAGGAALAMVPMDAQEIRGWTPSLALLGTLVPFGLAITVFRVRRDLYMEQMPPVPVLLGILAAFGVLALLLFFLGPRLFATRVGAAFRPRTALLLLALTLAGTALASRSLAPPRPAASTAPSIPADLAGKPNLILVMVDTLRADHLSCYGGTRVDTPNLCSLVADGGSIFDGFSHASWTKPATATLLTSLLPSSHGATTKPAALSEEVTLLSEVLQEHGYTTGGIISNTNLAKSYGFDQGYDEYHYLAPDYLAGAQESSSKLVLYQIARRVWFRLKPGLRFGDFYQAAEVVNEVAFDFLERHRDGRFFLFLHYMDPHDPYSEHPWNGRGIDRATHQNPDPSWAASMHELYLGEISYLEEHFGRLLARLRELDIYDDAVIALVSDHGEEFHEHGGWWHGLTLYEEQIRVPLLVKWRNGARPVAEDARGSVVGLLDVSPTLLAQAGAAVPQSMQGVDLTLAPSARPERNQRVFAEEDHEGNVLHAIRTGEWKYIAANPGSPRGLPERELFHVARDPHETKDLSGAETARVADLQRHAEAQQKFARSHATQASEAELTAAEEEALRQLGYVE
jgi:arylsulfatase A-like enzyme